jgi:hypothetical protein
MRSFNQNATHNAYEKLSKSIDFSNFKKPDLNISIKTPNINISIDYNSSSSDTSYNQPAEPSPSQPASPDTIE